MNPITLTFVIDGNSSALDIERAHATIDAVAGNFIAASLQSGQSTIAGNGHSPNLPGPTTTVENIAAAQGNVELDASGLPWDGRIHAGTKTKTQKGEWTKKKGCDEAVFAAVMAELRAMYPEPQTTAASVPAAANGVPTVTGPSIPNIGVPQINITPKSEYQKLCDYIAQQKLTGKLPQEVVDATFEQNGTSLAALAGNEEHSAAFREAFEGYVAQQG